MTMEKNQYFAYRSFWPELETMKKFRACGVETFCIMISNSRNSLGEPYTKYPPVWKFYDCYELEHFRKQVDDVLEVIPDGKLICHIDLNSPHWWTRYQGAMGAKFDSYYEMGKIINSDSWRRDTLGFLRQLLTCAEAEYPDSIVAYTLGLGGATEWHDRCRGEESIYRLNAFRDWQQAHGKPMTDIPGRLRRDCGSYDFSTNKLKSWSYYNGDDPTGIYRRLFPDGVGLLRTPEKNQDAIDYWKFCNQAVMECARWLLQEARAMIAPGKELGMFFGYAPGQWMQCSSGHLEFPALLDTPELDFVMAPLDYIGRKMDCGTNSMTVRQAIHLRGKRMLQEMDQRTYSSNFKLAEHIDMGHALKMADETWKNEDEVVAGLRRDVAYCLIKQHSLWFFDMWGGFYTGEKVFAAIRACKEIWDRHAGKRPKDNHEILVVGDVENQYLLNDMDIRCGAFHQYAVQSLSRCGAGFDCAIFQDLPEMDLSRIKLVVMTHPFALDDEKMAILKRCLLNGDRTILWLYGPGIVHNGRYDEEHVRDICGVPFRSAGLGECEMDGWHSKYIYEPQELNTEMMHRLAKAAGCHLYTAQPAAVCSNEKFLSVHTGKAERLEISLERTYRSVTELFSRTHFENTRQIVLESDRPSTFLLHLQ